MFVTVRETYDLHTTKNKMSVIAIHTPKPEIIKRNYPGLLMQCKAYRPVSADVRVACASVLPLDPKGVGLTENDVAPEDVFNPLLYKAMSNFGMSQLEARINYLVHSRGNLGPDVSGPSADVDVNTVTNESNEFDIYYGLLSETHNWKHAHPQSGLSMSKLKPVVWEILHNVGDNCSNTGGNPYDDHFGALAQDSTIRYGDVRSIRGGPRKMPFINCTAYTLNKEGTDYVNYAQAGFTGTDYPVTNCEQDVPYLNVVVGAIIVPPSRLHEFYYRMVIEWTLEFSAIRPVGEITDWNALGAIGRLTHLQNYDYSATKKVVTGDDETILDNDSCMVSANVDIEKVM